eukprot:sb/3469978/
MKSTYLNYYTAIMPKLCQFTTKISKISNVIEQIFPKISKISSAEKRVAEIFAAGPPPIFTPICVFFIYSYIYIFQIIFPLLPQFGTPSTRLLLASHILFLGNGAITPIFFGLFNTSLRSKYMVMANRQKTAVASSIRRNIGRGTGAAEVFEVFEVNFKNFKNLRFVKIANIQVFEVFEVFEVNFKNFKNSKSRVENFRLQKLQPAPPLLFNEAPF